MHASRGPVFSIAALAVAILALRSNSQVSQAAMVAGPALALQQQLNFSRDFEREADRVGLQMLEKAGCKNINAYDNGRRPGNDIHEMGGVRMGRDPKTSLLNGFNQLHHCKNVFVTDGACMTSTSTQNPSLTFMAFTARAVDHAVSELKKGNL